MTTQSSPPTPDPVAWMDAALKLCEAVREYAWLLNNGWAGDLLYSRRSLVQLARDIRERQHGFAHLAPYPSSALPATTPSDEAPRCTICGKVAVRQDIDGAWWPPCEHAKANGLHTLQYPSEGSAPDTPTVPMSLAEYEKTLSRLLAAERDSGEQRGLFMKLHHHYGAVRRYLEIAEAELLSPPSAPDTKPDEPEHPEARCERCGRPNVVWFTRNALWNAAVPDGGILCPVCFVQSAESRGIVPTGWFLVPVPPQDDTAMRLQVIRNGSAATACHLTDDGTSTPSRAPDGQ